MKNKLKLSGKKTEEIIEIFKDMALQQSKALLEDELKKYNRIVDDVLLAEEELKSREGDQRRVLISLFSHPNPQVRLNAAMATLAVEPEAAKKTLSLIWNRGEFPQAAHAKGMLDALDEGRYIPA